jgi:hypothetical protein
MFIILILEYVCFEKVQRINDDRDELKFHKPKIKIKPQRLPIKFLLFNQSVHR